MSTESPSVRKVTDAIGEEVTVAVCGVRPFDRAAAAGLCGLDPRLVIRCSTADAAELLGFVRTADGPLVVLLAVRVLREAGGSAFVDQLREAAARPRVVLVGTDDHATELIAGRAHADGYLRLDAGVDEQLTHIHGSA